MAPTWFAPSSHPPVNVMRQPGRFHPSVGHGQQRVPVGVNPSAPSPHSYPRGSPPPGAMRGGPYPMGARVAAHANAPRPPPRGPPPRIPPPGHYQQLGVPTNNRMPHPRHAPSPAMQRRVLAPPNGMRQMPQPQSQPQAPTQQTHVMSADHRGHQRPVPHPPRVMHHVPPGVPQGNSLMRMQEQRMYADSVGSRVTSPSTHGSRSPSPPPAPPLSSEVPRSSPASLHDTENRSDNIADEASECGPLRESRRQNVPVGPDLPLHKCQSNQNQNGAVASDISLQKIQSKGPPLNQKPQPNPDLTMDAASILLELRTSCSPATVAEDNSEQENSVVDEERDNESTTVEEESIPLPVVPKNFPTRLALPNDEAKLNSLHCFLRSELLEIFVVERSANKSPTHSPGSSVGRVGLRCVFCALARKRITSEHRDEAPMAVFYPKSIAEIYRLVTSWQRCHLRKCRNLPPNIRSKWTCLRENDKSRGKTHYWITSAKEIGLMDCQSRAGGIRFAASTTSTDNESAITPTTSNENENDNMSETIDDNMDEHVNENESISETVNENENENAIESTIENADGNANENAKANTNETDESTNENIKESGNELVASV